MDIKPTKLTTSDIYIGDKTDNVNVNFEAVETSYIGDNSTKPCEQAQSLDVHKQEVKKLTSSDDDKKIDSGCGDVQIETSNLKEEFQVDVALSDFEEDEECDGITWKWQEAMRDDVGTTGVKCVDVLDEINSHADDCEANVNYRSTPVMGRVADRDISSEAMDELDMSGEACSHHILYPSLLSTSIEDDDEDSSGFNCHDFKNPSTIARGMAEEDEMYNLFDEDLSDPQLRMWLRNKLDRSVDTSERSESNDEELMRLQGNKEVTAVDKEIQVSEKEILMGDDVNEAFAQIDSWFNEGASLQVKCRATRQTQTTVSFINERLPAGKDEGIASTSTEDEVEPDDDSTSNEDELNSSTRMNEHVKKLMKALPGIPPVSTDDGNMWLVPTVDENGNFFNVVVEDGSVWDVFIFRPSNPTTVSSTQTSEEEFDSELTAQVQHSL